MEKLAMAIKQSTAEIELELHAEIKKFSVNGDKKILKLQNHRATRLRVQKIIHHAAGVSIVEKGKKKGLIYV